VERKLRRQFSLVAFHIPKLGAVVDIAGSVAQFIDIGWRLVHRLDEYRSQAQDIPAYIERYLLSGRW
jgi:hypothetical protein